MSGIEKRRVEKRRDEVQLAQEMKEEEGSVAWVSGMYVCMYDSSFIIPT